MIDVEREAQLIAGGGHPAWEAAEAKMSEAEQAKDQEAFAAGERVFRRAAEISAESPPAAAGRTFDPRRYLEEGGDLPF